MAKFLAQKHLGSLRPVDEAGREEWRPTVGFDGYAVSNIGRVKALRGESWKWLQ